MEVVEPPTARLRNPPAEVVCGLLWCGTWCVVLSETQSVSLQTATSRGLHHRRAAVLAPRGGTVVGLSAMKLLLERIIVRGVMNKVIRYGEM